MSGYVIMCDSFTTVKFPSLADAEKALMRIESSGICNLTHRIEKAGELPPPIRKVLLPEAWPWDASQESIRAAVFGEMVKRATPILGRYLSDLYHDAQLLQMLLRGPGEFFYGVRESGTDLTLRLENMPEHNPYVWKFTLLHEDQEWTCLIESLPRTCSNSPDGSKPK